MADEPTEDVDALRDRLAKACAAIGLTAQRYGPTGLRIAAPGAGMLAEVISCLPDEDDVLQWCWSWGDPFCPATVAAIDRAAEMIKHVVTPAHA